MPHIVTFQDYRGERTWKVSSFLSHHRGVVMIENDFSRVKRNIDVPEIPQSEDAEIREYLESLGINYETSEYNRNRSRSPRSIQESQTDLRFAVQEGIDGAAKARNPEHALSPILAGLADFIAPGAADRFDSKGQLDHLRTALGGEGGASNGTRSLPGEQKQPDPQTYDKVAGDLAQSFRLFADSNSNLGALFESLKGAFSEANQAGLETEKLLAGLAGALKKPA